MMIRVILILLLLTAPVMAADDSVGVSTAYQCDSYWSSGSVFIAVSPWATPDTPNLVAESTVFFGGYGSGVEDSFMVCIYNDNSGEPGTLIDTSEHFILSGYTCDSATVDFFENASLPQNATVWLGVYAFHVTPTGVRFNIDKTSSGLEVYYKAITGTIPTSWPTEDDGYGADRKMSVRVYTSSGGAAGTTKKLGNVKTGDVEL